MVALTRRHLLRLGLLTVSGSTLAACGGNISVAVPTGTPASVVQVGQPTRDPVEAIASPTVGGAIASPQGTLPSPTAVATATPRITPTALPTATAQPTATPQPTSTPQSTATPVPTPTPRQPVTKVTKWGVGLYRSGGHYMNSLFQTKPTTILLMDPTPGFAQEVRQWFPKAFIVGRIYLHETDQKLDNPVERGAAFADRVAATAVPVKGVVNAWMSYNEVTGHRDHDNYRAYNIFQVSFANRLQGHHGVDAVASNDGSATVDPEDYPKFFAEAIRGSAYFGVHAYSPLGSRSMKQEADWHALRYRKIHAELERAGIRGTKMVITESGLGDGWHGRVGAGEQTEDFVWFTDELEKDSYMIGHAAYGVFGDGTWREFDLFGTEILDRMGEYVPATRGG
jgi:hypothetical protein